MTLPLEPECRLGFTHSQLVTSLGDRFDAFDHFMRGSTVAVCDGRRWDHEAGAEVEACGGVAHGMVVYESDLRRFLAGVAVNDD